MTVDSEIFMPKSKAPKMDELDYSKWTWLLAVFAQAIASQSRLLGYLLWCGTIMCLRTMGAVVDSAYAFIKCLR